MIKLNIKFSTQHITIYLIKDKNVILTLSTKNSNFKNHLFRTNNLSAMNALTICLSHELKYAGINEPITLECNLFKGKIVSFIKLLTLLKVPVFVKNIKPE